MKNALVIGSGAREHALTVKLSQSKGIGKINAAPGNPGMGKLGQLHPKVNLEDPRSIVECALDCQADLVVIGSEVPLCAGAVDALLAAGIPAVGPSQAAAEIEGSKKFGREVAAYANVPHPICDHFRDFGQARQYVLAHDFNLVIKKDGLAAGKGVWPTASGEAAMGCLRDLQLDGYFDEGGVVLLEERLTGREVSGHALTDGETIIHLPYSCDHKRLYDGDLGPNTGGMGCYCRAVWLDDSTAEEMDAYTKAVLKAMRRLRRPYRGFLYPGWMVTKDGLRILEFNCRLGDPEAQVILPLLEGDLFEILLATTNRTLNKVKIDWSKQVAVGVVLVSEGYGLVERPKTGFPITGIEDVDADVLVFHAGTKLMDGQLVTAGGRVLTVVALGHTLEEARERVYDNVGRIHFRGKRYRKDIGLIQG